MNDDGDVFGETTTLFKLVRVVDMAIMATDRWDLPIFTHRVSGTRWGADSAKRLSLGGRDAAR